ncbi:MAG: class I SAM-dependent methyltransferase [Pseudomonadota bacterium]
MVSFSPEWLDRREPADRLAHSPRVLGAVARHFLGRDALQICDLGAGTGATLRAVREHLPRHQDWVLVDYDDTNLAAAETRLAPVLEAHPRVSVQMHQADLSDNFAPWPETTELVTASALFDLTAPDWIYRFVSGLEGRPLLALLTYDGRLRFSRFAPEDGVMAEAFNNHQQTDKGFGPAAGPQAAAILREALEAAGYEVLVGDSTWHLGEGFRAMRKDIMDGWAVAADQMGVRDDVIERWQKAHADPRDQLLVGHTDLWAVPQPASA